MPPPTSGPTPPLSPRPGPDPRLWYIAPSVLQSRRNPSVSLTSPALEHTIIQLGVLTNPLGRPLTRDQKDHVRSVFGGGVDSERVRVVEAVIANAPTTLGNQIRVAPGFSFDTEQGRSTLIHEMAHVWQYQVRGSRYITEAAVCQIAAYIRTGDRNAAYMNYQLTANSSIFDFQGEEQAQIIEDYYDITVRYAGAATLPEWAAQRGADRAIYQRMIDEVRRTQPRAETVIYEESLIRDPADRLGLPPNERSITPMMPMLEWRF